MTHQFDNVGSEGSAAPSHTPGPWEQTEDGFNVNGRYRDGRGFSAHVISEGIYAAEAEANARLIAAAPDLLAALEHAKHFLDCLDMETADSDVREALAEANAAIARTKGE